MGPMSSGAVTDSRIDATHGLVHYNRPASGEIERRHAGECTAAKLAVETATEKPMARLREAVEAALNAGRVSVDRQLSPDVSGSAEGCEAIVGDGRLAAELPGILQEALDRMGRASSGLDRLVRDVVSAAAGVRDRYAGPVSPSNGDGVRGVLHSAADDARASASMRRDRVVQRRVVLERWRRRLNDAAAAISRMRRELQEAQHALNAEAAAVAQDAAGASR